MDPERYEQLMDTSHDDARAAWVGVTLLAALAASCGSPSTSLSPADAGASAATRTGPDGLSTGPLRLRLVAERNVPPGTLVGGHSFGGISALVFRDRDRQLVALSDGRAEHGPARMFLIDADDLEASRAILLGEPMASQALDLEGIARASDGSLWIATEGDGERSPRLAPAIWRVDDDGRVLGQVPVPTQLLPTPSGELVHGVRANRGLEGLTAPRHTGAPVIAAVEQACAQDGPSPTFTTGTTVRLVIYDGATPGKQHAYRTDPVPAARRRGRVTAAEVGISALAALDRTRLLVMERAGVAVDGAYTNHVWIYEVDLEGAKDVSDLDALPDAVPVLDKHLVLDLGEIVPDLDPAYGRLDNFEAMALGTAPDGSPRLYLASDDNFSDDQRTALLVFAIEAP